VVTAKLSHLLRRATVALTNYTSGARSEQAGEEWMFFLSASERWTEVTGQRTPGHRTHSERPHPVTLLQKKSPCLPTDPKYHSTL